MTWNDMDIYGMLIDYHGEGTEPRNSAGAHENSEREMPEVYQVGKLDRGISGKASMWSHHIP